MNVFIHLKCRKQVCIATALHIITLMAAFSFGASGFVFNIYDSLGKFSKTTVLVGIAKSVLGLYWIGIGIYANSLAARLFSNKRMVDCIRLHSKTFLKVSLIFLFDYVYLFRVLFASYNWKQNNTLFCWGFFLLVLL